jgi:succinoglycan biosynthesis transport protein ExoP
MPTERFFLILRARWRALLLGWLGTIALVLAISFSTRPAYKATASVLVERKSIDPIAGLHLPPGQVPDYIGTQIAILKSAHVALEVVRALKLEQRAELRELWKKATGERENFESWLSRELLEDLVVRPALAHGGQAPRDSSLLSVSYGSRDPGLSSEVANAFVDAYMDAVLKMRLQPARHYNAFFDSRAKQLGEALEEAQARLSAYRKKHNLVPSDEGPDVESHRLAQLTTELVRAEDALTAAKGRHAEAGARARQTPEVLGDPVVAALSSELARQETRLSTLRSQLGEANPEILDLRAGISGLRNRVQEATARASGAASVALKVAEQRATELRAAVERQHAKVLQQQAQRDAAAVLLRDVQNAQRAYDAVLDRANKTALESQDSQPTVLRIDTATTPARPYWPKVPLNVAVAAVLGLLFGVLLALWREARDTRLRSAEDVVVRLRQPVLLSLPDGTRRRLPTRAGVQLLGVSPDVSSR